MAEKTHKTTQISKCPCGKSWILVKVEMANVPNVQPKQETEFFDSLEEAGDASQRFLEPSNIVLVPPTGGPKRVS
jgi:hypothetical protein